MARSLISSTIIGSDAFKGLPHSSQALYIQMLIQADNYGFVNNAKSIALSINAKYKDVENLVSSGLILKFPSEIFVIKHYFIHNSIKPSRRNSTNYSTELSYLAIKTNNAYTLDHSKNNDKTRISLLTDKDGYVPPLQEYDGQMTDDCWTNDEQLTDEKRRKLREVKLSKVKLREVNDKNDINDKSISRGETQELVYDLTPFQKKTLDRITQLLVRKRFITADNPNLKDFDNLWRNEFKNADRHKLMVVVDYVCSCYDENEVDDQMAWFIASVKANVEKDFDANPLEEAWGIGGQENED